MPTTEETTLVWQRMQDELRARLSASQFDTWFAKTRCIEVAGEHVTIEVPNAFYQEWLKLQYLAVLKQAAAVVLGGAAPQISITIAPAAVSPAPAAGDTEPRLREPAPAQPAGVLQPAAGAPSFPKDPELNLNPEYTFENFIVGSSNRLAHAAALAVVEGTGRVYNPLFIHGGLGLGKTHVLQAVCHSMLSKRQDLKILYIPCEQFINRFIMALEKGQVESFRQRYRMLDVLVIDDIHFLANKEHTQEEFFHTFNTLYNERKQIILSSDSPPKEIPNLEERLVSRFKWGLVCEIESPSFETRVAIIRKKAGRNGLDLGDDVVEYLASSLRMSVREIEGAVTNLLGYSSIMNRPITLEVAKEVLGDSLGARRKKTTLDRIITLVTESFGVRLSDLQSKKRFQSITLPRQVCMYLARRYTNHSLAEIGGSFGGRDHSTVLYATDKIASRMETDTELRQTIQEICRQLES
jgi:chromosomal replication initiator protein